MAQNWTNLKIWGAAAFLAVAGSAASCWQLWASHGAYLGAAEEQARSLSNAAAQRLAASLRSMDVLLADTAEKIDNPASATPADIGTLRLKLATFPEVDSLSLIDTEGLIRHAAYLGEQTRSLPMDVSDRAHIRFQMDHWRQKQLFIGTPTPDRFNGKTVILLSRPIVTKGERLKGVVGMAVLTAFIDQALASVVPSDGGAAAVFDESGILFSRQPTDTRYLGKSVRDSEMFRGYLSGGTVITATSFSDGVDRILGFAQVPNYPVVTVVGVSRASALKRWHHELWVQGSIQALFAACIFVLALRLTRSERRRHLMSQQLLSTERAHVESLAKAVDDRTAELNDSLEALTESEERFRLMVEISPLPLVLTRRATNRVAYINSAASECFGVPVEQSVDELAPDYWDSPSDRARMVAALTEDGHIRNYETTLKRSDGQRFTALLSAAAITMRGEQLVLVCVLDITERKRLEEELGRSNRDLEQFSYAVSHDLQEPLRMVSSYLTLLERRYGPQLDESAHEFIGFAVDGALRMSRMISDLLEYSRVHRRGNPMQAVDLNPVLADALANLATAIQDSKGTVEAGPLPTVTGDASQLMRVFQNLIGNALKYRSPDIPPHITISAETAGGFWVVAVADNGIGIDPAHCGRLFQVFQRLHPRGSYEGSGVGLALCRRILERHGGRIWVDSAGEGQGSTFHFALPIRTETGDEHK